MRGCWLTFTNGSDSSTSDYSHTDSSFFNNLSIIPILLRRSLCCSINIIFSLTPFYSFLVNTCVLLCLARSLSLPLFFSLSLSCFLYLSIYLPIYLSISFMLSLTISLSLSIPFILVSLVLFPVILSPPLIFLSLVLFSCTLSSCFLLFSIYKALNRCRMQLYSNLFPTVVH